MNVLFLILVYNVETCFCGVNRYIFLATNLDISSRDMARLGLPITHLDNKIYTKEINIKLSKTPLIIRLFRGTGLNQKVAR